jgi:hypothetical protein
LKTHDALVLGPLEIRSRRFELSLRSDAVEEGAVDTRLGGEPELGRFRLPVSGRTVILRHPTGFEDLLLLEAARTQSGTAALAAALMGRLIRTADGEALVWDALSVTDLDAAILRVRQALLGDRIRADTGCPAPGCGCRIDIDFGIEDYLAHHAPRAPTPDGWTLEPAEEDGWFCMTELAPDPAMLEGLAGTGVDRVRFHLPTVADLVAVADDPRPERALTERCLQPADPPERFRQPVEEAMEALAPSLSGDLQGKCPECGHTISVQFDARWFCLRELRERAAFIYQDVDLLARRYHWSEAEILALPHARRAAYAELARRDGGT